ncbi:MAG: hypothetical protein HYY24_02210 [Verrucomicrobia bacterium]|nr:hypothetical protein [Verrucomicrobiota bacterium]
MNKLTLNKSLGGILLGGVFFSAGCETTTRENIISSVNTGIGVSIAENPKTELYEVKVGYIRSQFYSVPTGKTVEGTTNNSADVTPEMVSGIRMTSDARHLFLGVSVAENFAVGKVAVMSPAAVAMYIADARTASNATAAATAVEAVAENKEFVAFQAVQEEQGKTLDAIRKAYKAADATKRAAIRTKAETLGIVAPNTGDAVFLKRLNLFADGTAEHLEKLNTLLRDIE